MTTFDDDVQLYDLVAFAKAYNKLGWSIQEQLDDMLNDSFGDLNENAVRDIETGLKRFHPEIETLVARAKESGFCEPA